MPQLSAASMDRVREPQVVTDFLGGAISHAFESLRDFTAFFVEENFVVVKHMAANLARCAPGKESIRLCLKTAAWDDNYLANLITA